MLYNKKSKNVLKFVSPSSFNLVSDALPTGNGTIGVNVCGGAGREVITINHTDLFWQGYTGVLPDVSDKVKNIAKNLASSNYREAENVLSEALKAKKYRAEVSYPLPVCDLIFNTCIEGNVNDYVRQLSLETGEIEVSFKSKNIKYARNIFASRANDTICYNLTASNKKLNGEFEVKMHSDVSFQSCQSEPLNLNLNFETKTDKDFIIYSARNTDGTDFGLVARVLCVGGVLTKSADKFIVKNAESLLILAKVFVSEEKSSAINRLKEELSLINKTPYDKLLKEHYLIHSKLISQVELNLNSSNIENINSALLTQRGSEEVSLSLLETLYNFGKHLYACSINKKVNSFGLFNGEYKAPNSTIQNYLQLQRLHNFAFKGNLASLIKPIFERFYDNLDDYKKNSTRIFGCKGIYIPSIEAPESGLPGSTEPSVIMNYNVASYVASMIYNYFVATLDVEFMEKIGFELLEETAIFYEEIFKENKTTKVFENGFGYSPFSTPANIGLKDSDPCSICSNCVADFSCARFVFSALSHVCVLLDKPQEEIEKYQNLLKKVPDYEVDKNGYLKEYIGNVYETNNSVPYIPHLFPFNIGFKQFDITRDFEVLVANTVKNRFANSFGKFTSNELVDMAISLSTVGDSGSSYEVIKTMVKNFITSNLIFSDYDTSGMGVGKFSSVLTKNIDKNIGLCLALQNMFVCSSKNNISLFKCLPSSFTKGSITNIILNNQIKVDVEFNLRRGIVKLKLKSPKNMSVNVNMPNGFKKVKGVDITNVDLQNLLIKDLSLPANKVVGLKIYFANKSL